MADPHRNAAPLDIYGDYGRTALDIVTPEGVVLPFLNASFGERLGALLIDLLIMIAAFAVSYTLYRLLPGEQMGAHTPASAIMDIAFLAMMFFVRSGYFMFFEMGVKAATPGKRIMKLRIIAHDGGRLTPSAVFTRNALREVELYLPLTLAAMAVAAQNPLGWLALLWALALLLLPLFNRQHARLGDYLAGTRVVHMPRVKLSYDLADLDGDRQSGLSFTPEQLAYGEMELGVLEQVLRERKTTVMKAVADKIKTRIGWQAPKHTEDIPRDEDFLRAYYSALRAYLEARMLLGRRRKDKHDPTK